MFLKKIKFLFSFRALSFCLVFFISFSIFCFGFGTKKTVKANPLVPVIEQELAPIIISILGGLGISVSAPTAHDFLDKELEQSKKLALEGVNKEGLCSKTIQATKNGYLCSKEFVTDVINNWESYVDSIPSLPDTIKPNFRYYTDNMDFYLPSFGSYEVYFLCKNSKGIVYQQADRWNNGPYDVLTSSSSYNPVFHIRPSAYNHLEIGYENGAIFPTKPSNYVGFELVKQESYSLNSKVNNSLVSNLNDKNGIFLPMPVVNDVSKSFVAPQPLGGEKVESTTTFPVGNIQTGNLTTTPVSSIPKDVSIVGSPSDVGCVPWADVPSIDKPVDGADSKPVDGTDSKPVDGFLGFLQSILDILKQILAWLQGFLDAFLEFLKHLLVPREGYFIDTFNNFKRDLDGKFGIDAATINSLKDNSNVADPQFIYNFIILGVPVTLDLSFIKKSVPYCHIFFGGLTAIFLCWFNLKNILFFVRGTSYISPTGEGKGEK